MGKSVTDEPTPGCSLLSSPGAPAASSSGAHHLRLEGLGFLGCTSHSVPDITGSCASLVWVPVACAVPPLSLQDPRFQPAAGYQVGLAESSQP